ncbi:YfiR family protein [Vibrio sp. TBV020]|uniref:YfiR family protein n=1 Tax=Vibrio sp. TBV020 TaxID=3137398 RepID=UPI0038CD3B92
MLIDRRWGGLLALLILLGMPTQAVAKYTPEQVKAVYLYRIVTFIHWDNESEMQGINICVADDSKIEKLLAHITEGKQVRNKPLNVVNADCHVLFISQTDNLSLLDEQSDSTVTIGGMERFTTHGGAIELVERQGKIKPRVNLDNIEGYQISSNFLRVAIVEGDN